MSVFDRLAARAAPTAPALAVRRAGRFEPGARGATPAEPPAAPHPTPWMPDDGADASVTSTDTGDPRAGVARHPSGPATPAGPHRSSPGASSGTASSDGLRVAPDARRGAHRADGATGEPSGGSVRAGRSRDGRPESAVPDPSRARATHHAGPEIGAGAGARANPRADTASPGPGRGDHSPSYHPPDGRLPDSRPGADHLPARPHRDGSPTDTAPHASAIEDAPRTASTPRTRPGTPPRDRADGTPAGPPPPDPAAPRARSLASGARRPRPRPAEPGTTPPAAPTTRTLTRDELLARLTPALVADGTLSRRDAERIVAVPARATDRRRASRGAGRPGDGLPGDRPAVGLDPVDVPAEGDVHVHIGRVEIHRPDPRPDPPDALSPAPERLRPPRVDHGAYLARQEGRWRR